MSLHFWSRKRGFSTRDSPTNKKLLHSRVDSAGQPLFARWALYLPNPYPLPRGTSSFYVVPQGVSRPSSAASVSAGEWGGQEGCRPVDGTSFMLISLPWWGKSQREDCRVHSGDDPDVMVGMVPQAVVAVGIMGIQMRAGGKHSVDDTRPQLKCTRKKPFRAEMQQRRPLEQLFKLAGCCWHYLIPRHFLD